MATSKKLRKKSLHCSVQVIGGKVDGLDHPNSAKISSQKTDKVKVE